MPHTKVRLLVWRSSYRCLTITLCRSMHPARTKDGEMDVKEPSCRGHQYLLGEVVAKDGKPALRWGDVRLSERRLTVQSRTRRLKTTSSSRDVPLPDSLVQLIAAHRVSTPRGPADAVLPHPWTYGQAQKVFGRAAEAAALHDVRVHDLRHTFAVHAIQSGLPLLRLQKLLGHATPAMTMRYARHAGEGYFAEDAARIAASLSGTADREVEAVRRAVVRADTA